MKMYATFFWILAFLTLLGLFVPDEKVPGGNKSKSITVLAMLILLALKVYPFSG